MRPSSMHQHVDDEDDEMVEVIEKAFEQEQLIGFSSYEYVAGEPVYVGPLKLRIDLPIKEFIKK